MFDDFTRYPRPRVKLFFNYLVNAAARVALEEKRKKQFAAVKELKEHNFQPAAYQKQEPQIREIEERLESIDEERKEHLETKMDMFLTHNKYLPFEIRLRKIKERYFKMRRSKKQDKIKIRKALEKIKRCEALLRNIKKIDSMRLKKFHDV